MYDLAASGGSLDAEKLEAFLTPHESGARVLLAPTRPDQATSVTAEFLDRVYALLHSMHDYVLVDTPPGFTPEVIALLDRASDLCVVTSLDVPSLKATKVGLETLTMMMGHELPTTRLVLNRSDSSVGLSQDDVSAALGREPDALVPSSRGVTRSLNEGKPITLSAPRSEAARALKRLAHLHQPAEQPPSVKPAGGPRRLLARR